MKIFLKIASLLIAVGLFPLLFLGLFMVSSVEQSMRESVDSSQLALAKEVGKEINRAVQEAHNGLSLLAGNPLVLDKNWNPEELHVELSKIQQMYPIFNDITLLQAADGRVVTSVHSSFRGVWRSTTWFQRAMAGEKVLSGVHAIIYPFEVVQTAALPIVNDDGKIRGVLVGQLNMQRVWAIIRGADFGRNLQVYLIDREAIVVGGGEKEQFLEKISYPEIAASAMRQEEKVLPVGDGMAGFVAPIEPGEGFPLQWSVVFLQPAKDAYRQVHSARRAIVLATVVGIAVVLLISLFLSRWFSHRFNSLLNGMRRLGQGDFTGRIDDARDDELGELCRLVDWTGKELKNGRDALLLYNMKLEELVEERTVDLRNAQSRLLETAHHAGMAEVATGILHNINNVLSSVNIKKEEMEERLRHVSYRKWGEIYGLVQQHADQLGDFLIHDPRGKNIFPYLAMSAEKTEKLVEQMREDLRILSSHVEYISNIVALQQRYARGDVRIEENVLIGEILQDSLKILENYIKKGNIEIDLQIEFKQKIALGRAQLVQIFVNIIKNAAESLAELNPQAKKISIRAMGQREEGREFLEVRCRDNGKGFTAEQSEKLFTYGASFKDKGRGFGLHYCLNYLTSIGGSIRAESEGIGRGAEVVILIPIKKAPAIVRQDEKENSMGENDGG